MADPKPSVALPDLLLTGPCEMRNFHRPDRPPAYWCDQCQTFSRDGECKREAVRDA